MSTTTVTIENNLDMNKSDGNDMMHAGQYSTSTVLVMEPLP